MIEHSVTVRGRHAAVCPRELVQHGVNFIETWDDERGCVERRQANVVHTWVVDTPREAHLEVAKTYENGGQDMAEVVDREEAGHWATAWGRGAGEWGKKEGDPCEEFDGATQEGWPHDAPVGDVWEFSMLREYTEEESQAAVNAKADMEVAQAAASQSENLLRALAADYSRSATDSQAASVSLLLPTWDSLKGATVAKGTCFTHGGRMWRASQGVVADGSHTPGDEGLDALWYSVEVALDGVIVWEAPRGAHDAPNKGDLRHHPGADGELWRSLMDGNTVEPGTDDRYWERVAQ